MNTLEQVINALTICNKPDIHRNCKDCPMPDTHGCMGVLMTDALQYLKWYKDLADDSEAFAEWKENPPLTWTELRTMAGKPVWVEKCQDDEPKGWLLIQRTNADVVNCTTKHGNSFYLYRSLYGEKWQAYRKERNGAAG